jgi:hypothetical protein
MRGAAKELRIVGGVFDLVFAFIGMLIGGVGVVFGAGDGGLFIGLALIGRE